MLANHFNIAGLSKQQVVKARAKYGENKLAFKHENGFWGAVKNLAKDPMIIILFVAASIYFISGEMGNAIFLTAAIIFEATISLYQDARSRNALSKLKTFTQPHCKVIRESKIIEITSEELVIGDCMMVEEGSLIAADGTIIHSNDFSVNESILTGESFAITKDKNSESAVVFKGSSVASGLAIATVTAIGNTTKLGEIGKSIEEIPEEQTPLEKQIINFVKKMAIAGALVFVIVWVFNYVASRSLVDSLLKALTLAMSILPEEIPVAFTTFMALGAWRLMKMGIVVKQMKTVETLGSATIICTDKTGTLTENKMSLAKIFVMANNSIVNANEIKTALEKEVVELAMWASEPIPFDTMEIALHEVYKQINDKDERTLYKLIHEYPLEGKPPMMTHIFENNEHKRIVAAKGAAEAIIEVCNVSVQEKEIILNAINQLANEGYRVLGIAIAIFSEQAFPEKQQQLPFGFKGLVAFYDPPKKNIQSVLKAFYQAGIQVKIITGDNATTTAAIAKQIGFKGFETSISGDELMQLSDTDLQQKVAATNVFTRMFPEAKLKIINALKSQNEIVAMTGDGVNDGPALRAAHIGIAMGKKGTEIAKSAASLILLEDDLSKIVDAITMGRKIYVNLKKAIQYIISIHIPIIFTVFIPLVLAWKYPNIFSPIHIIFLELIMGPTCSIIYENEPIEKNTMLQKPRPITTTFFNWKELTTSIIQGIIITIGAMFIYQFALYQQYSELVLRTMVFLFLISANIFLTLINRSFYYSVFVTLKYKNNFVFIIIAITIAIVLMLLFITPVTHFFQLVLLNIFQLSIVFVTAFVSVFWYELVKVLKRKSILPKF